MKRSLLWRLRSGEVDLGRFLPLKRIMSIDTFNDGQHGWASYFPDYDGWDDYPQRYPHVENLSRILNRTTEGTIDDRVDRRFPIGPRAVPQLTLNPFGAGEGTGGLDATGRFALKIATLPRVGAQAVAKKRLGTPWHSLFRVEAYFGFGGSGVHYVSLTHDVHDADHRKQPGELPRRWWPGVRYLNEENGQKAGRWQILLHGSWGTMDGPFDDIMEGQQSLGAGWHYLRLTFDVRRHVYVDFNCDGTEFEVSGLTHTFDPPLTGFRASTDKAHGLVFPTFGIRTSHAGRGVLYLDSVVISASEE